MKKQKKRVLGLLGLVLVAVATIFAAFLPGPEASAVDSITDTIVVRVVGNEATVSIYGIENYSEVVFPDQTFHVEYGNAKSVSVRMYKDGGQEPVLSDDIDDANYDFRTLNYPLDLLSEQYGYGEYVIEASGVSYDGSVVKDFLTFSFYPVTGQIDENDNDGLTYLDLNYDTDNKKIDTIKINVYDENGNLVGAMSPITVKTPGDRVELPFSEDNLPTGNYRIEITAYNSAGELLYGKPYTLYYYYENIPVPDTGALFNNLNISKTDYLITGLILFLSAAGLGMAFVAKGRNKKARLGKKRR